MVQSLPYFACALLLKTSLVNPLPPLISFPHRIAEPRVCLEKTPFPKSQCSREIVTRGACALASRGEINDTLEKIKRYTYDYSDENQGAKEFFMAKKYTGADIENYFKIRKRKSCGSLIVAWKRVLQSYPHYPEAQREIWDHYSQYVVHKTPQTSKISLSIYAVLLKMSSRFKSLEVSDEAFDELDQAWQEFKKTPKKDLEEWSLLHLAREKLGGDIFCKTFGGDKKAMTLLRKTHRSNTTFSVFLDQWKQKYLVD